ncbi:MAG TPA: CoA transferase [Bacteroidetes bacterium]|nr:CoA transferase [Bacteroidota bacterium]
MRNHNIFKNLKIIELASVLAGPAVGQFFAELGATVIKIENKKTGGDVTRKWKLPKENKDDLFSAYYHSINWGKESMMLDLSDKEDKSIAIDLIAEADILIANFKKGSAKKLGLDFGFFKNINQRLIYANMCAYGEQDGRSGFDVLMQAETGFLYMNGEAKRPPVKMPVALIDILAAHQLKEAILIALLKRKETGKGNYISVSLVKSAIASLANQASNWLNTGHIPQRMGTQHPNISPYGDIFLTKDKKEIILAVGTEKQFAELCDILNLKEIKSDKRFSKNINRLKYRNELIEILEKAFLNFNQKELLEKFDAKKVPAGTIRNMQQVFDLPEAKEMVLENKDGNKCVRTIAFEIGKN